MPRRLLMLVALMAFASEGAAAKDDALAGAVAVSGTVPSSCRTGSTAGSQPICNAPVSVTKSQDLVTGASAGTSRVTRVSIAPLV